MPITNLYIDQGIDYEFPLELWSDDNVPLPLINYQVFGQIRKFYGVSQYYTFNCEIVDAGAGVIHIHLPASTSSTMKAGRYVYDVVLIDPIGTRTKILEGSIELIPQVTEVVLP